MGSPAFKRHLIHRAVFLAGSATRTGSGQVTHTWTPISNGSSGTIAGRFVHRRNFIGDPEQGFMMGHEHLWMCDDSEDVDTTYRVRSVVDRNGTAISEAAGTWEIRSLALRWTDKPHHYELKLEQVR